MRKKKITVTVPGNSTCTPSIQIKTIERNQPASILHLHASITIWITTNTYQTLIPLSIPRAPHLILILIPLGLNSSTLSASPFLVPCHMSMFPFSRSVDISIDVQPYRFASLPPTLALFVFLSLFSSSIRFSHQSIDSCIRPSTRIRLGESVRLGLVGILCLIVCVGVWVLSSLSVFPVWIK